ncbi:MAG: cadherin domain-containing protein [Pseudorhodoferax sp.]
MLQGGGASNGWDGLNFASGSGGSTVRGLVVQGFEAGIHLQAGSDGNTIVGNYIGALQADGTYTSAASAPNTWGVLVESANNTIGGTTAADRNVIAGALGSGANVGVQLGTATGNRIIGNYVGTDASGTPLGLGGEGVYVRSDAADNRIGGTAAGEGNLIAGSAFAGVAIFTGAGTGNAILGNSIHSNGGLGIDLDTSGVTANDAGDADTGPNNLQNFPLLTLARTDGAGSFEITGSINTTANSYIRIELFASTANDGSGHGEGQTYLGFVNVLTDGSGNASFSTTLPATVAAGAFISATATRSDATYSSFSDTSEFARSVVAIHTTQQNVLVVTTAADTVDGDTTSISTLLASKGADGFISLREALIAINNTPANGLPTLLNFGIAGSGVHTITLGSALPGIARPVVIDATTDDSYAANGSRPAVVLAGDDASGWTGLNLQTGSGGSTVRGLVVQGFSTGINVASDGNTIAGNYIGRLGTDGVLSSGAGNTYGVYVTSAGNTIGGTTAADANVVSGNHGANIQLGGGAATANRIIGNVIGASATGAVGTGNNGYYGIWVAYGAHDNQIGGTAAGEGNVIAGNYTLGVHIEDGTGNAVLGNSIHSNGSLGIALSGGSVTANDPGDADTGPNNLQNFPVLTLARTDGAGSFEITGSINSTANTYIRIELFASTANDGSGYGEGQTYLGFVNVLTNATGNASFSTTLSATVAAGAFISATATKSVAGYGSFSDTSEFARSIVAISSTQAVLVVDTAADTLDGDTTSISTLLASKGADGFISLREAITAINNTPAGSLPTLVNFAIAGTGVHTINLATALPTITRPVFIDGRSDDSFAANGSRPAIVLRGPGTGGSTYGLALETGASGSTVRGLSIQNFNAGIYIAYGSSGNTLVGNYVGALGSDGSLGSGGNAIGIIVRGSGNTIGSTLAADGNVVSGNVSADISLDASTATGNRIIGNNLGTNAAGVATAWGSYYGVWLQSGAHDNQIGGTAAGEGNRIAGHNTGVFVAATAGVGNAVLGNSIYGNSALGIDLGAFGVTPNDPDDVDTGPNNLQNFPVLTLARTDGAGSFEISGSINTTANTYIRIELFANTANDGSGYGEGQTYLGFVDVLTDGSGNASFSTTLSVTVAAGAFISATATRSDATYSSFSDTSEFARSVVAIHTTQQNVLIVDTAADTVDGDTTSLSTLLATKGADGRISLREAIIAINNTPDNGLPTLVNFGIAGTGVHTITLGSDLPHIANPVVIDATTDDSFAANGNRPAIQIDGNDTESGLVLQAGASGSTIRGLALTNFFYAGIYVEAGSDDNVIAGNYLGRIGADGSLLGTTVANGIWVDNGSNNRIGGSTAADRNVLIGVSGNAILVVGVGSVDNVVQGNWIGVMPDGASAVASAGQGIAVADGASGTQLGGLNAGEGNWIARTDYSAMAIANATGTVVQGNRIGTDATGTSDWGVRLAAGMFLSNGASGSLVQNNVVAFSGANAGVLLAATAGAGNALLGNLVYRNAGLDIDLNFDGVTANDAGDADTGPNDLQNFPVLATVDYASGQFAVTGSLNSAASTTYRIEFFGMAYADAGGSGHGGGPVFLGFVEVTTDAGGNASFGTTLAAAGLSHGAWITTTATQKTGAASYGSTSEFAANVQAANTAPLLTVPAGAAYTENAAAVTLAPGATVVDTELAATGNYAGATLTLQRDGGADAQDLFAATGGALSALTQGGSLVYGGTAVGTVTANSGGTLVLTFDANATQALVDGVLRAIGYANGSDAPPASVTLAWSFSDGNTGPQGGGGALVGSGSTTVAITAVNDAPVVTGSGGTLAYTENDAATPIDTGLTVSDVDNASLAGATVTISGNYASGQDVLAFVDANGITGSWNAATGVLTLTGNATLADYQAALRSVTYVNTSDDPSTATRTVSFTVNDGTADSVAVTRDIAVTAVNDIPAITSPASVAVPENTTEVLRVTASDPDAPAGALVYSIAGGADAAHFAIDAQTGALRFIAAPDFELPADADGDNLYEVRVRVSDGDQSSEQALVVQVTPVNDNAPRFTTPGGVVEVPENSTEVVRVQAVDDDLPAQALRYSIVGGADAARFAIDAQTGALRFLVAPDFETPADADGDNLYEVRVRASDGDLSSEQALTVRVTPVNDNVPRFIAPDGVVRVPEYSTEVRVQAVDDDLPAETLRYSIVGGADAAHFAIDASTGRLRFLAPPQFSAPRDADGDNLYEVLVSVSDGEHTAERLVLVQVTGADNPVVQPNPVPAAPVPAPTPPVAVPELPGLPATGTGPGLGSDAAAGEADATEEGGLHSAGSAEAVYADHVPGTRPAPAVLLAPSTQKALPADLLLRVQWSQPDYRAAWGDTALPDLLLPDLLRSQPVGAGPQTGRGPWPDAGPVVADTSEQAGGDVLQARTALNEALAGGIAIGLGAAFWASRGSALLASLLAMSPAWTSMDPLPVLNRRRRGPHDPRGRKPFGGAEDDNASGTEPEDARRKDDEAVAEDKP